MRYEVTNRYYGTKMVIPSEEAKDRFLVACKKDPKDNQPVWVVSKELPDADLPSREGEFLTALSEKDAELEELKKELEALKAKAPPKKAKVKKDGQT